MATILVFSEQDSIAFELLSRARELGEPAAAVLGKGNPDDYFAFGARRVYVSADSRLAESSVDVYAAALAQMAEMSNAAVILLGSTKRGKELAGRLAQRLGCGAVADAIGVEARSGKLAVQRYALGGNTVATETVTTERQVIAVMPRTFEAVKQPAPGEIVSVELRFPESRVRVVERRAKPPARTDIEAAQALVVVGKGFARQQDLTMAEELAHALNGEVGCTRALAADYHWLGEERIIGISGKKIKPRLMVSLGVSGQIQHTVGILGSKVIVAINKDKTAPIFKVADYGIVGDLYQVVPKLVERLRG